METVFLKILNMSITAGWLVLAVILIRLLLHKAPKSIRCILWAMVGIRLLCPFTFESVLSLIPSAETVPEEILYSHSPMIHSGITILNETVNPIISNTFAPNELASANPLQVYMYIASIIWVTGIFVIFIYASTSYLILHRKVCEAVWQKDNIWLCDHISTPFILGIFRPRIFIPSSIAEQDQAYVTAHENAHLQRHDHWWKLLAFTLLAVYWFHPLLWLAYRLFSQDIELACDEKVMHDMGSENKKPYADALINCSASCGLYTVCPLAFCEIGVASRVKAVLHYKRPTVWIMTAAVILCIAAGVCFLTNPSSVQLRAMDQSTKPETIRMTGPHHAYTITSETAMQQVLDFLNNIQIGRTIITTDQNPDINIRDRMNNIVVYYNDTSGTETEEFFFSQDYTLVWTFGDEGPINAKKINNSKTVRQFFNNQIDKIANDASKDTNSTGTNILYTYKDSPDFIDPVIALSMEDYTFSFAYSAFSSYLIFGTYELTDQTLTLRTSDELYTYVFYVSGDSFIFDASKSSQIPEYRYSGASKETKSPVPDGAIFTSGTF